MTMFPGDVEAYLENLAERREHDLRVNAATLTKRKQLETFINKNRANANTASQARSKAKQLERLNLIEVQGEDANVRFSFPEGRAAARPCAADRESDDRLPRPKGSTSAPGGSGARLAGGRRRRQWPGQDDVSAHGV